MSGARERRGFAIYSVYIFGWRVDARRPYRDCPHGRVDQGDDVDFNAARECKRRQANYEARVRSRRPGWKSVRWLWW